jgi:hypothetical protein
VAAPASAKPVSGTTAVAGAELSLPAASSPVGLPEASSPVGSVAELPVAEPPAAGLAAADLPLADLPLAGAAVTDLPVAALPIDGAAALHAATVSPSLAVPDAPLAPLTGLLPTLDAPSAVLDGPLPVLESSLGVLDAPLAVLDVPLAALAGPLVALEAPLPVIGLPLGRLSAPSLAGLAPQPRFLPGVVRGLVPSPDPVALDRLVPVISPERLLGGDAPQPLARPLLSSRAESAPTVGHLAVGEPAGIVAEWSVPAGWPVTGPGQEAGHEATRPATGGHDRHSLGDQPAGPPHQPPAAPRAPGGLAAGTGGTQQGSAGGGITAVTDRSPWQPMLAMARAGLPADATVSGLTADARPLPG